VAREGVGPEHPALLGGDDLGRRFARASSLAIDALSLMTLYLLSRSSTLMTALRPEHAELARVVNAAASLGLAIAFTVVALQFTWRCVRYARTSPR
jgi:hypothetical protein